MIDLVTSRLQGIPSSSYTVKDTAGKVTANADMMANLESVQERLVSKVADDYIKFEGDWERFYATIMGQLCLATKEEL